MTIKIEGTTVPAYELPTILWDNLFTRGVVSASGGTPTSYPVTNATTENTVVFWQPAALPASIVLDMTVATLADCASIVGHNCGSKGNTLYVESSTDNVTWTTRSTIVPTDNTTILTVFPAISARYWRVRVAGGTAPIVSVVMLGQRFTFPAGIRPPYKPVWLSQTYEMITSSTLGGQFVGNKIQELGGETQINLVSFERGFGESTILPFRQHYNEGKAFVFAAGPSIFLKDVGYVWRKENSIMAPMFDQNGSWMSASMEVYCYGK